MRPRWDESVPLDQRIGGVAQYADPALKRLDAALRTFSLGDITRGPLHVPTETFLFESLPSALIPIMHEEYFPALTAAFGDAAYDAHPDAVDTGLTLLAFYVLIYPPNHSQIGELTPCLQCLSPRLSPHCVRKYAGGGPRTRNPSRELEF